MATQNTQQAEEERIPGNAIPGDGTPTTPVIQTINLNSGEGEQKEEEEQASAPKDTPPKQQASEEETEDLEQNAQSFEESNDRLWNQNLRLIAAIFVAILSAAFLWWFVS